MENIIKYESETHEAAVDKYECGYARFSAMTSNNIEFAVDEPSASLHFNKFGLTRR